MANGIYIGMSGAIAAQRRLDIVANNVANASTPGFRQQRAEFQSFLVDTGETGKPIEKGFVALAGTSIDDTAGVISQTGNPLDMAIDGPGYFVVNGPTEPLLTRAGNFRMATDGTIVDQMGNAVAAEGGAPIRLRPEGGPPGVGSDGTISQDGTIVARLSVVNVASDKLQAVGDTHMRAAPADMQPATNASISGGALEGSNVNPVRGLVELVQLTQEFQTNQKVMSEYRKLDSKLLSSH
jgi:flagellar basal-body rod protein FlgF